MSVSLFRRNARYRKNGFPLPAQKGPSMFPMFRELFRQIPTWMKVLWICGLLVGAGITGVVVHVLVHFVTKFW